MNKNKLLRHCCYASLLLLKCLLRHSRVLVGAGQYTRGPRVTHGTLHARASLNRVGPFRDRCVGYTHSGGWGTRKNDILSTHGTCFWRAAWTPRGNVDREARFGIQIHAWRVEMARRVDAAWKCYRTYWLTLLRSIPSLGAHSIDFHLSQIQNHLRHH